MYLRFVMGTESEDFRWLTGIFTEARILKDEGRLDPYQVEALEATYDWFNDNVPCPPFSEKLSSGKWTQDAVAWFLPTATEAIQHMWSLAAILQGHGLPIRVLRSVSPGLIVYRDDYQVVAETAKRS